MDLHMGTILVGLILGLVVALAIHRIWLLVSKRPTHTGKHTEPN
jgi:hypothetical protein